ncbi:MAG: hypothetical protein K1000chlam4_00454 [Chlamydiae bacterium]|nr:hypothetical protein [Chlamydiota bacterium]
MLSKVSHTLWPVEGSLFNQKAWVRVNAIEEKEVAKLLLIDDLLSGTDKKLCDFYAKHRSLYPVTDTFIAKLAKRTFGDANVKERAQAKIYRDELKYWRANCVHDDVIDTSAIRGNKAPVYSKDAYSVLLQKAVASIITTPFYLVGTIGYYLLRIVPVSIFIFGAALKERNGKVDKSDRKHHFVDIPKEVGYSLWQVVISPYYALGYLSGLLISIVLPMSGWKMATSFERKWSDDVPKSKAYWIPPLLKGRDFKWLTTTASTTTARHHAHGPQCRHPVATAVYRDGNLDHIETLEGKKELATKDLSECGTHWYMPAGCER